jgi:hypothetical protein
MKVHSGAAVMFSCDSAVLTLADVAAGPLNIRTGCTTL